MPDLIKRPIVKRALVICLVVGLGITLCYRATRQAKLDDEFPPLSEFTSASVYKYEVTEDAIYETLVPLNGDEEAELRDILKGMRPKDEPVPVDFLEPSSGWFGKQFRLSFKDGTDIEIKSDVEDYVLINGKDEWRVNWTATRRLQEFYEKFV